MCKRGRSIKHLVNRSEIRSQYARYGSIYRQRWSLTGKSAHSLQPIHLHTCPRSKAAKTEAQHRKSVASVPADNWFPETRHIFQGSVLEFPSLSACWTHADRP